LAKGALIERRNLSKIDHFAKIRKRGPYRRHSPLGSRHAAGLQYADAARLLAGKVHGADAGAPADPHVLQHAVVDEGERLAVLRAHEEDKTEVQPRIMTQGSLSQTGNAFDMAITGDGFFKIQMPDGTFPLRSG
jgi:hypothetical protein